LTTIASLWRYGDWRHVATGCTGLVYIKSETYELLSAPFPQMIITNKSLLGTDIQTKRSAAVYGCLLRYSTSATPHTLNQQTPPSRHRPC